MPLDDFENMNKRPRDREAFFFSQDAAAGVAAVATDFRDVLVVGVLAMIAAVHLVSADRACTAFMTTSVFVRHINSPLFASNFAAE